MHYASGYYKSIVSYSEVLNCSRSWKLNYCMAIGYFSLTKLWLWSQLRPIRSVEYTKSESNLISIFTINVLNWGTFSRSLRSQEGIGSRMQIWSLIFSVTTNSHSLLFFSKSPKGPYFHYVSTFLSIIDQLSTLMC